MNKAIISFAIFALAASPFLFLDDGSSQDNSYCTENGTCVTWDVKTVVACEGNCSKYEGGKPELRCGENGYEVTGLKEEYLMHEYMNTITLASGSNPPSPEEEIESKTVAIYADGEKIQEETWDSSEPQLVADAGYDKVEISGGTVEMNRSKEIEYPDFDPDETITIDFGVCATPPVYCSKKGFLGLTGDRRCTFEEKVNVTEVASH